MFHSKIQQCNAIRSKFSFWWVGVVFKKRHNGVLRGGEGGGGGFVWFCMVFKKRHNGVFWGVVWCGLVWFGVVWCGLVWFLRNIMVFCMASPGLTIQ